MMCKYCENLNESGSEIMNGKTRDILGVKFSTGVYVNETTKELTVEFGNDIIFHRKIKYCPMCGEKLDE